MYGETFASPLVLGDRRSQAYWQPSSRCLIHIHLLILAQTVFLGQYRNRVDLIP